MSSISNFFQNLNCLKDSDWIEWQPDEKKRIRILDLLESVRKTTLRKSASSAGCSSTNAISVSATTGNIRSPKNSGTSLSANEETGRALRLHHSRHHSHSLRNLSSPTGSVNGSQKPYQILPPNNHDLDGAKIHPDQTFTRRILAEQRRAKSNLDCYDHEKSFSSDSDSSQGSSSRNSDQFVRKSSACGLDCPDNAGGTTWYRHKSYGGTPRPWSTVQPRESGSESAKKRYFTKAPEHVSSQSFHQDLSLPRPSPSGNNNNTDSHRTSPPSRYFTAMETPNSTKSPTGPPQIRSTISKFRELYLSENPPENSGKNKQKMSSASHCVPTKFGCATLPTKLKQTASFNGKLSSRGSAPQMNHRKSPSKSFGASKSVGGKLEARRQVSAPQIGNQLPEEVRQVYEKITRGQKVTIAKKPDEMPPLKVDKWETSPRLGGLHSKREAFKPASHFSEVRGYENAVPDQKCKTPTNDGKGDDEFNSILESNSEFKTMTSENSMFETAQNGAVNNGAM